MTTERYHAFLSYFSRLHGVVVHQDVLDQATRLFNLLQDNELNIFLQTSGFGPVLQQIVEGLENSTCYVILLTKNYMEQVNTSGSLIQQEFLFALDTMTLRKTIVCVLENEMLDRRAWKGIFKFRLGAFAAIDITSTELLEQNLQTIIEQILGMNN